MMEWTAAQNGCGNGVLPNGGSYPDLRIALGSFAYIEQGDDMIVIEPQAAARLADMLAVWAAHHPHPKETSGE